MSTTSKSVRSGLRYNLQAYHFVFAALRAVQQKLGRQSTHDEGEFPGGDEESAGEFDVAPEQDDPPGAESTGHISGPELLSGIRELALAQFGLLTKTVFRHWGVQSTDDFGRIVFELIERGEMRKTRQDRLSDFFDVYDFDEVFDRGYKLDTRKAFQRSKAE